MRARYLLGTCLGALMAVSTLSNAQAASLETELTSMLAEHPQLKSSENTQLGKEKAVDVAKSGYYPTVSLNSDYGHEHISTPSERADSDGKDASSMMRRVAGIEVSQNLFNGFSTQSSVRTARLANDEAKLTIENTRQGLLFEGISVYLEVLKHKRRIDYARENEANIKKQMELEDERVRRGSGIGIDVLNAKSRLQTAIDRRVGYEGDLAQAADTFEQVFGHAPDIAAMIDPAPPLELLPQDMEEALEKAIKDHPTLASTDIAIQLSEEAKRGIRSEYYPSVDLTGSMNYEKDKNATEGVRRDYSVLVEATWNLYSGGSTSNSMKQANYDAAASKNTHLYTTRKIVEGTRRSWHDMETNQERLSLKENDLVLKEEIFLSTRKQRESGAEGVDVLNVLDREKEVYQAKIEYADLFYDTRKSIFSVLYAIGELTPENLGLGG